MEGRETGTEGQRKAAAYIESQFKEIGLKFPESLHGYQQYYPLFKDSLVPKALKIGTKNLNLAKIIFYNPALQGRRILKQQNYFCRLWN